MYHDGQIITKSEYTAFANWNNTNGNKFWVESLGDGTHIIREIIIVEPTIEERNENIKRMRASLYSLLIDPLHAERQRKVVLDNWTNEMETEYIAKVKKMTKKIQTENPYIE